MNNQPVTVEQLMQAVSMLGGRPEYKQYALTDPGLLKQAYHFVRACQEELPKFVETEVTPRAALAARPPHLPDGPVVTFEQAAVQITNLASRGAKKRFEQFLNEDLDYLIDLRKNSRAGIRRRSNRPSGRTRKNREKRPRLRFLRQSRDASYGAYL